MKKKLKVYEKARRASVDGLDRWVWVFYGDENGATHLISYDEKYPYLCWVSKNIQSAGLTGFPAGNEWEREINDKTVSAKWKVQRHPLENDEWVLDTERLNEETLHYAILEAGWLGEIISELNSGELKDNE